MLPSKHFFGINFAILIEIHPVVFGLQYYFKISTGKPQSFMNDNIHSLTLLQLVWQ